MSNVKTSSDSEESDTSEFPFETLKKRKRPEEDDRIEGNELKKHKRRIKQKKKEGEQVPLNLDRQCGVPILPGNELCSRAITCKIHSVGAKRAVVGRSQSFKDLVAMYQKKGRVQVPDKEDLKMEESPVENVQEQEMMEEIDSDEEVQTIYGALRGSRPRPLGERKIFYVQRRQKYYKIRDILLEAITPKSSQCQMPHMDI